MTDMKELRERYLEVFENIDDETERKKQVVECMLKNELLGFAQEHGIPVENRWTKGRIAEELINPDIYNKIVGMKDSEENTEKEDHKDVKKDERSETEEPGKKYPSFQMFPSMTRYGNLWDSWQSLSRGVEDNLKRYTGRCTEHWERLEDEWVSRAKEFQKEIDGLGEEGIPPEDYKDMSVLWRNFLNKMTARFFRISSDLRERDDHLTNIINRYDEAVRDIFSEDEFKMENMGRLYSLSLDMTREIRDQIEKTGRDITDDFFHMSTTWEKFSIKTVNMLNELRKHQGRQTDGLYGSWNAIFKEINSQISGGIKQSRGWYDDIWKTVGEQGSTFLGSMGDVFKEVESNYTRLLRDSLDFMQSGHSRMINPDQHPAGGADDELENIRKRIEELEKKL